MKKIIVFVLGLLFVSSGVFASDGYNSINVDDHFIRIEITDATFPANSTKSFDFTPELSGRYALFFGGVNNRGGTTDMTVSISEGDIPVDITYRDSSEIVASSYTHTRAGVNNAQYERVGDYRAVHTELEKDTTYTLSISLTGTASDLAYIDIRRVDIDINGEDVIISPHDFYDMTGWQSYSVNSEMPWLPLPEWPEGYSIVGNYKSNSITEQRAKSTVTRGATCSYNLNFKRPGKYKIGVYGQSASGNAGTNIDWDGTYKTYLSYTNSTKEIKWWDSEIEIAERGTHTLGFRPGNHCRVFSIVVDFVEPLEDVMDCSVSYNDTSVTGEIFVEDNRAEAQSKNMFLILATYDENNIMNDIQTKPVTLTPGTPLDDSVTIYRTDWDTARMYLWDGTDIQNAGKIIYNDMIVCEK